MDGIKVIHDSQSMKYRKPFGSVEQGQKVKLSIDIDKEIKDRLNTYEYIITSISERKRYQNIVYDLRRGKINNPFCFDEEIKMTMDNKAIALFFICSIFSFIFFLLNLTLFRKFCQKLYIIRTS